MAPDTPAHSLDIEGYPLSKRYDPEWVRQHEMGPNVLWLTEFLTQMMDVLPGMRVLDLGCGKALSSIFLATEFKAQVWATDLWITATDNFARIRDANQDNCVFPIQAEARSLPFAQAFFDRIISVDSFHYFGSDIHYLEFYLLPLLKPGGQIGVVIPASPQTIPDPWPTHLGSDWYWLRSMAWWQDQWQRHPQLETVQTQMIPKSWELWVRWNDFIFSGELINEHNSDQERQQILADQGQYLGFLSMVATKTTQRQEL